MRRSVLSAVAAAALAVTTPAMARIVRLEIVRTEPAFGRQVFGPGASQHITAIAHGRIGPG